MKTSLLLLAPLLLPLAVHAQGWSTLPFGSSAAHVRVIVSRQPPVCAVPLTGDENDCTGLTMEALPTDGDYTVKPQFELWLGALNTPLHFQTLLHFFNTDRQLARIQLTLDADRYKTEGKTGADLLDYASEPVLSELMGKYGLPLAISSACEPAETHRLLRAQTDIIECSALWKHPTANETVSLAWKYQASTGAYSMTIRYAALQGGL